MKLKYTATRPNHTKLLMYAGSFLMLSSCYSTQFVANSQDTHGAEDTPIFTEDHTDISFEHKPRRKWDNAIIADLDKDGHQDLLLTDHGYSIKLYWNDDGKFGKGTDIIMGDMHGITVGDYNSDGDLDILISRGGGSGTNARNAKIFSVNRDRQLREPPAFEEAFKKMRGRTTKLFDGDNDGDLDLILTGIPLDFTDPKGANHVYENDGLGEIAFKDYLPATSRETHRILITDYNNDNIPDLIFYGDSNMSLLKGNGDLTYDDVSSSALNFDLENSNHITSIAEIDYDNDGDLDLYLTRATELEHGTTFYNKDTQTLAFFTKRQRFRLDDVEIGETLEIENYQAGWPHFPVWVGESGYRYEFEGETHSGRDLKIVASAALGWPDEQEKRGFHFGYVGNQKWRFETYSFPPMTAIIKGVKNYNSSPTSSGPQDILLENTGNGFVDATSKAGLKSGIHSMGSAIGDFNNDGFPDIFIVKRGDPTKENHNALYLNQGDSTFKEEKNHGAITTELGSIGFNAETFDYNQDGLIDLITSNERGKWHLFKNTADFNEAKFVNIQVGSSPKTNASAIGALVKLEACDHTQTRRVGSSSSPYSQSFNTDIHFGLGECSEDLTVTVQWSDGGTEHATVKKTNTTFSIGN